MVFNMGPGWVTHLGLISVLQQGDIWDSYGPIWDSIWVLNGLPIWGQHGFCNRETSGNHIG